MMYIMCELGISRYLYYTRHLTVKSKLSSIAVSISGISYTGSPVRALGLYCALIHLLILAFLCVYLLNFLPHFLRF